MTHRPCGACAALVPVETGCAHWRQGQSVKAAESRERRRVEREQVEAFRRQMGMDR